MTGDRWSRLKLLVAQGRRNTRGSYGRETRRGSERQGDRAVSQGEWLVAKNSRASMSRALRHTGQGHTTLICVTLLLQCTPRSLSRCALTVYGEPAARIHARCALTPCAHRHRASEPRLHVHGFLTPRAMPLAPCAISLTPRAMPLAPRAIPLTPRAMPLAPRAIPLAPRARPLAQRAMSLTPRAMPLSRRATFMTPRSPLRLPGRRK